MVQSWRLALERGVYGIVLSARCVNGPVMLVGAYSTVRNKRRIHVVSAGRSFAFVFFAKVVY